MSFLVCEGLTKRFSGLIAVNQVSFSLERGEVFGLIGPNGAGKTTLLNLVSGLLPPTAGRLLFEGRPLTGEKRHAIGRMGIARTFQIVKPFKGLTVRENVAVGAMYGSALPLAAALEQADAVLERIGLLEKAFLPAETLNLAERKRLELGRALAMNPKLLLLDEVMAGLTPREVGEMLDLLRDLNRQGMTILVVEHVTRVIMEICHRVLVIHHGKKLGVGSPQEIAENEEVVRAYLGDRFASRHRARAPEQVRPSVEPPDRSGVEGS